MTHRSTDGRHDFDFLFGYWEVAHRRVVDRTDPECDRWEEFHGTSEVRPVFGGLGHVDLLTVDGARAGGVRAWQGLTVRQFDPDDGVWRIWWSSSIKPGRLDPPMTGRFEDGVGRFSGVDVVAGRFVEIAFEWTAPEPDAARWSQAFSYDGGHSWWENWVMSFRRARPARAGENLRDRGRWPSARPAPHPAG